MTLALGVREEYSVGVGGDTIYSSLHEASQAIAYLPLRNTTFPFSFVASLFLGVEPGDPTTSSLLLSCLGLLV